MFLYSSASEDLLGTGKRGAGPTGVALRQVGPWSSGGLAKHIWSFAGEDDRADLSMTFLNPFVSYVTDSKMTFSLSPELTYDWESEEWLALVNFIVSQLFMVGRQPLQVGGGYRYYFDVPDDGPEWGLRFNVVLLFPK